MESSEHSLFVLLNPSSCSAMNKKYEKKSYFLPFFSLFF